MNKSFTVSSILALSLATNFVVADTTLPYRLKSTTNETYIYSVDNSLPGDGWGVVFVIKGDRNSKINGKQWDAYIQKQIVDCGDLTYVVVDGMYFRGNTQIHSFNNMTSGKDPVWKSANGANDNARRVIEFCAMTKIHGD
jgi:hypothetical protein